MSSDFDFEVGDRVRIVKSSTYYTSHPSNPRDTPGTITSVGSEDHGIWVAWDNGKNNTYRVIDLEFDVKYEDSKVI